MTELARHETGYEVIEEEPPEQLARNLLSAAHLFASATAFFFLAFLFAYFYLRSLNNNGQWHPKHVDPSLTLGTLSTAAFVASALLVWLGLRDHREGRRRQWRQKGALALAVGVAGIVLQVVEWFTIGFGPTDGGYASVFFGWTAFYVLFAVGALYWLETTLATSLRYRKIPSGAPEPGEASGDPHRTAHDVQDPLSMVRPSLEAVSFYWSFVAGIGVLTWIILYLA